MSLAFLSGYRSQLEALREENRRLALQLRDQRASNAFLEELNSSLRKHIDDVYARQLRAQLALCEASDGE